MAERKNRSIVDAARAMLEEKNLPKFYWAEAVRAAVYIQNRIRDKVSAHELYFGTKPNLRHLRVFGTEGETEEVGRKGQEMHLGRLLGRAEGL